MSQTELAKIIDDAFEQRDAIGRRPRARCGTRSRPRSTCSTVAPRASPSEERTAHWRVNQWLKKAVLLSFRLNDMSVIAGRSGQSGMVGQGCLEVRRLERRAFP